jgi:hypothetical protein
MSAKWRRIKSWDDANLTGPLLPVKWVLRALSSITLAVTLLILVALYGVSASVPLGMLVQVPKYAMYGLSILLTVALVAALPAWLIRASSSSLGLGGAFGRFVVPLLAFVVLIPVAWALWHRFVWPVLHFDPATGRGLKFFALAQIGRERHDLAVVGVLQPFENDRGVEAAGIGEDDFFNGLFHGVTSGFGRGNGKSRRSIGLGSRGASAVCRDLRLA